MNRIEYIRYSHRRANSRVRAWIGSVRMRLARRSRLLGWLWMVPASIFYALVVLFSWLTFCVVLFRDPRFTLHYLESEIECRGLTGAEARRYLDKQHRDYERRLAYGNFTRDEQRRINQTFAYLYNRYPAPARDDLNARLDEVQSAVAEIAGFTRQRVAGAKGCFLSKLGKPLTAKDLSAAKQMADIIDAKREQQILDCIRALEAAQS